MWDSQHAVDITPLTEWCRQISHLQAGELTSARHHEPPVWGLDTDSQSCDTVGDVQGYGTVCEYRRSKTSMGL